ncbi:hypothetical protein [Polymorphobacter megasporae]|uniref:hypothetical protein n=1 Tax=Glacieibacterium megasporae TaxID=2835787 RepID=UPI001C1DF3F3|nr:hypothetical protein [Polymorphobacter megasporae]UAJ10277.1 hypothetical protein KTC28_00435 [Polymorphobacter megasporae]
MTQAALYRENAHKIRRLVAGVTGSSRDEALNLAQEYEARAQELDKSVSEATGDGPTNGNHAVGPKDSLAERIAALIGQRGAEVEAIRARELDHEIKLAAARVERALLEARIAGIIEASGALTLAASYGSEQRYGERSAR